MGLFDFFSNKPTSGKIEKLKKRILNEHQQQQIRQESIDQLVSYATPEAIGALVTRLGYNFRDTIKNEQEKRYIADLLVEHFGIDSVQPMLNHIRNEKNISSVIMTLGRIMPSSQLVNVLLETLSQYTPDDHRFMEPRLQLVDALADHEQEEILPALLPYLMDHDDNVRVKVMDFVDSRSSKGHSQFTNVVEGLIGVLKDPHASGRITRRSASILARLDTDLSKRLDELDGFVPDGYTLGTNGRLSKS